MEPGRNKIRGMTLIEVLVVISILGIFMSIAMPAVMKSFKVTTRVKSMTIRYSDARKALGRISESIRRTYPAALDHGISFEGKSASIEAGPIMLPHDRLSFPIIDTRYSHLRSAHRISYSLDLDPSEGETLRGLVEKRSFIGAKDEAGVEKTVTGKIVGLDFRYLDDSVDPARWVEQWPPSASSNDAASSGRVPAAVKTTIFVLGEVSPEPKSFTTITNIPARPGQGI
jgi:prepilin-type N-terminal cleavage/methylation domain-containing protein